MRWILSSPTVSASIDKFARFCTEETALPAIALPQCLPRLASRPGATHIANGRRAAREVSGSAENIRWLRNRSLRREPVARRIRGRERAHRDRTQPLLPQAWGDPLEARSLPARNQHPECARSRGHAPSRKPTSNRRFVFAKSQRCPKARSASSRDALQREDTAPGVNPLETGMALRERRWQCGRREPASPLHADPRHRNAATPPTAIRSGTFPARHQTSAHTPSAAIIARWEAEYSPQGSSRFPQEHASPDRSPREKSGSRGPKNFAVQHRHKAIAPTPDLCTAPRAVVCVRSAA